MKRIKYPLGSNSANTIDQVQLKILRIKAESTAVNDLNNIITPKKRPEPTNTPLACFIDHLDVPAVYCSTKRPEQKKTNPLYNKILKRMTHTKAQTKKINNELKRPISDYLDHFFEALHKEQQQAQQTGRNIDRAILPIVFDEQGAIIALTARITLIKDDRQKTQGILSVFEDNSTTLPSKEILQWYYENYKSSKQAIRLFIRHIGLEQVFWDKSDSFTKRELDCVMSLAEGKTAKETAKELGISHRTVETHLENVKIKFNTTKKTEILSLFFRHYRSA